MDSSPMLPPAGLDDYKLFNVILKFSGTIGNPSYTLAQTLIIINNNL